VPEPAPRQRRADDPQAEAALASSLVAYPITACEVRRSFPQTDDDFIAKLVEMVMKKVGALNGHARGDATDELIGGAVRFCREPNQRSAGLYLRTIPRCVATWLVQGQPHDDGARLPLSDNSKKAIELEGAINRRLAKC
jgi:hypothetical protein